MKIEIKALLDLSPVTFQYNAMNTCRKCQQNVQEILVSKTGYSCKQCVAVYNKAYRATHKAHIAESKKTWAQVNKDRKAAQDKQYAQANPEARKLARAKWRLGNPEADRLAKIKYVQANRGRVVEAQQLWARNNPVKRQASIVRRRLAKDQRTPAWLTVDDLWIIQEAYGLAALRREIVGGEWHVDHIIPLRGKQVSGLHVPWNLQVIPAIDNRRKSNKYA